MTTKTTAQERLDARLLCEVALAQGDPDWPEYVTVTLHATRVLLLLGDLEHALGEIERWRAAYLKQVDNAAEGAVTLARQLAAAHQELERTTGVLDADRPAVEIKGKIP